MSEKRWLVCPIVRKWDDMETSYLGRRIPFSIDEAGIGFLEVYDSYEDYNAQYPNIKPWILITESCDELTP